MIDTYTKAGTKAQTPTKLDKAIFGLEVKNHQLLKDAYLSYLSNSRPNLAVTKKRGQVSGGGAKPWRQKGTGRARVGSSRNPIWRGGGVAFGPTGQENYTRKLNVKAKRQALRQALSLSAGEDRIKVIEQLDLAEAKTKSLVNLVKKLGAAGQILVVVAAPDEKLAKAASNLSDLKLTSAKALSAYSVMNADCVIIEKKSLEVLAERLGDKK